MRPLLLIAAVLALLLAACGEEVTYQGEEPDAGDDPNNDGNNDNNDNNIRPECSDAFECEGRPHDDCVGAFACVGGQCVYECADAECVEVEESLRAAREAALACDPAVGCALVDNAGVCNCGGTALSRGADLAQIEALAAEFNACFGARCIPCELPMGAACVDGACVEVFGFECAPEGRFGRGFAEAMEGASLCMQDSDCGVIFSRLCGSPSFGGCYHAVNRGGEGAARAAEQVLLDAGCVQPADCNCAEPSPAFCDNGRCALR